MKLFVRRTGGRIGLWGGLLATALAAFAAGWLVPVHAPVGCRLNELTAAPDFSPFSPAAPVVAASDAGTPAASSLPEKWVCLTFDDGPSKTTPDVLNALIAAGVHATFFVVATGHNEKYLSADVSRTTVNTAKMGKKIADASFAKSRVTLASSDTTTMPTMDHSRYHIRKAKMHKSPVYRSLYTAF